MIKNIIITLFLVLLFSSSTFGQGSGTYIIPTVSPYTPTSVESLLTLYQDSTHTNYYINQDTLGTILWFSESYEILSTSKLKSSSFVLTENHYIKLESQFDTLAWTIDYETQSISLDSTGSEFWTETIDVSVVDSTEIVINSTTDVTAKIVKVNDFYNPAITELTVVGNGIDQTFIVNLNSGKSYIISFVDSTGVIVNIKKIGV